MSAPPPTPSFERLGPVSPDSPVVMSVTHAGRDYPAELLAVLLPSPKSAATLEDRHVDAVARRACGRETMLVQHRARAWIDLNRRENERDPEVDEGAVRGAPATAKSRGGLGLVPRRASDRSPLWRRRWRGEEIDARIVADHRPYHETLAAALAAARARFGVAVLLDLHSMPPLPGPSAPLVVVGDRHGRTAGAAFARRLADTAAYAGLRHARNMPYAGGHVVERHGTPRAGIHALQLELDRSLYLDAALDHPAEPGLSRTAAFVRAAINALADEALSSPGLLAAE